MPMHIYYCVSYSWPLRFFQTTIFALVTDKCHNFSSDRHSRKNESIYNNLVLKCTQFGYLLRIHFLDVSSYHFSKEPVSMLFILLSTFFFFFLVKSFQLVSRKSKRRLKVIKYYTRTCNLF